MQIKAEALADYLAGAKQLSNNCVLIYGQEVFLAEEAAVSVGQYAKQNGFSEREVFYISARDNLNKVAEALTSLSLFAGRKIVEVRFDSDKLNKKQSEALLELVTKIGKNLLLIQAVNIGYQAQKEAWFKKLVNDSLSIVVSRVEAGQFPNWIGNRAKQLGLQINGESVRIIVEYAEGNLLWAQQILTQLSLLSADKVVDAALLRSVFVDNSVFQINDLSRLVLTKSKQLFKVGHKLEAENISPVLIASVLIKDLTILYLLLTQQSGQSEVFKQQRIWSSKQKEYLAAQKHYNNQTLQKTLMQLAELDKINKGAEKGDAWLLIHQIIFELSR